MGYYWIILILPTFFGSSRGDCGAPPRLDFGEPDQQFIDQNSFPVGANVSYTCRPGFIRDTRVTNIVTCLSDSTWSTPETFCTRRSCPNPEEILNGEANITDRVFGSKVYYTCHLGYRMITKRDYIECLADGTWSKTLPVCEVQMCPPPHAITDGTFQPDKEDYEYQEAVVYTCNDKNLALIGQHSLSCTAFGNWSSEPPHCKAVECDAPNVKDSEKISGFTGPYILNSAVSFRCLPGYTMNGASSVKCNDRSEWEPPLPTCSRIVTQSPATTKETETTTGGGNNVGAIVGNALIIFTMSIMAFVINDF